ncbi:recombinase family protein [Frankia sp. R43]|uniref:recombinase family protein n=1 Tax=Frankia sp. R43 TaxID=269536 RepID=UPI001F37A836|nr:recombinase family protein [Frankia sp. R43]
MSFVRDDVSALDRMIQRSVFLWSCRTRGWEAGPTEHQQREGLWAWSRVLRQINGGGCQVVIVDTVDRLASSDVGRNAVLALLRREGVRLVAERDGVDTGDAVGRALVDDLISPPGPRPFVGL